MAVLIVCTYWAYESAQLYVFQAGRAGILTNNLLFDTALLAIPVAALLGVFLGTLRYRKEQAMFIEGKIERHDELMFLQHWSNAIGIIILIITGFVLGFLFIPRTVQTAENIGFVMNLHFVGVLFFSFGASFYVTKGLFTGEIQHMMPKKGDLTNMIGHYKAMIFGGVAPKEEKFLSAERVVFPMWIIGVMGITLTGIIKIVTHFLSIPEGFMGVMTFLHGVFAIYMTLMLIAHVIAGAILPASWPLIRSMITGKVTEKYVKHHHEKWYEEIKNNEKALKGSIIETKSNKEKIPTINT
ncbi:cytochrome b/b6 domain-containing protein [Neobacillus sp. FSL H8-0543]|uniref:cytochrome b/b6 domain-containing protein n=1 Tax=Neobacillus sp. FSL H8-0543 TaxID=2954672 RepID=UPI00315881CF